jgi:hypothetical protein
MRRSGDLSGCYAWRTPGFELGPCLRLTIDDVTAQGKGPEVVPESGHIAWLSAGAAARARWSPTRWTALFVSPSLLIATSRPNFAIDGVGPVHRVPVASFGATLGCEWIF